MFQIPKKDTIYILDAGKDRKEIIHTIFCLKPLDMYLLNSKGEIVEYHKKVKPFRIIIPKKEFRFLIEGLDLKEKDIKNVIDYLSSKKLIR